MPDARTAGVPVIVTCSHFSTRIAAARARAAASAGAAMLMLMPPLHTAPACARTRRACCSISPASRRPRRCHHDPGCAVERRQPVGAVPGAAGARSPTVRTSRSRCPGTAAKLRSLIDGRRRTRSRVRSTARSRSRLMADLDAGATGTMPSALLPDLIKPVLAASSRGPAHGEPRRRTRASCR